MNYLFLQILNMHVLRGIREEGGACPKINKVHGVKDCLFNQARNELSSQDCNFNIDKACNPKCK